MGREPLLQITTQQLDYLVTVADAATWAEAAAELGVSQSALSQGLSQLERRLGVVLFERSGRRRLLRPATSEVLHYARRVVADTRDLGRWAGGVGDGTTGQLRVGMIDLAAIVHFGPTLQAFRAGHPDLGLHLSVAPSAVLAERLLAGELSLAVIVEPPRHSGDLEYTPLLDEELGVYGPQGSGPSAVGDWGPWVTFPTSSHTRHLVARSLAELGATFEVIAESHQPEVLRGMVALGMGWTVLPVSQAETEPNPLHRARVEPLVARRLVAARRRSAVRDPAGQRLLDELRLHARSL